jgi:NAD(P)-dependent dehydrogenase (short-subunit alcohol dehydrogenase family)
MSSAKGMKRLEGRVVVVTGASMGIGRAASIRSAEEGATVAVCDIEDSQGEQVVNEIKRTGYGTARYYHLDVSKDGEVSSVFKRISEELGPIYGLVNNAGIVGAIKPTHELSERDWDAVFAINVKGVFLCTKYAIPGMIKQGTGSIVNLSSIYGLVGAADQPPYHASKGAVRLMSKTDALFYAKNGVRVNSVHPGFIDTLMVQNVVAVVASSSGDKEAVYQRLKSLHPLGRLGKAEEIAAGIVFLLSDDASFVTGSELVIDGGYTCQ